MKKLLGKRSLFLVALLVSLCMPMKAQEESTKSTFNVASVPVEGVPQTARERFLFFFSLNVSLKQTALAEEGTKQLSLSMSKQDWSIIGLYEDYNYHTQLMSSLGNYSSYAKSDNGISRTDTRNSTDGLGLLVKSGYTLGDLLDYAQWKGGNGANILEYTQNGNLDKLVYRGYRCWPVTLPNGAIVDVYTFHLDNGVASSSSDYSNKEDKNAIARRNQIASLVSAIKTNAQKNKRPAIVMGLTNNLYTNEGLKQNLIDAVNGVDGLIIKDAWVELMRGGKYPTYPSADETPGSFYFNDQNGEVVNKVFYINNDASDYTIKANSYYRDVENFASLDHKPVVVNFTVEEKGAEDDDVTIDSESWVIPEDKKPTAENPNAVLGEVVTSGTQYFIKNVSSGHFLMAGATWGTRACEGSAAMPITITKQGTAGSTYTLATLKDFVFADYNAEAVFMDGGNDESGRNCWVLEPVVLNTETQEKETTVEGIKACQYYIYHTTYGALTSTGSGEYGNLVYCTPLDKSNDKQKWVLLTSTNMRKFMSSATVSNPFDITPFMFGGADFGRLLVQRGDASTWGTENGTDNNEFDFWYNHDGTEHNDGFAFRTIIDYNSSHPAITVEKNLLNMPQGTYHLSFEGFYHVSAQVDGRNQHLVLNIPVTLGANSVNLYQNNEVAWATKSDAWGKGKLNEILAIFRDGDAYRSEVETTLSKEGELAFKFSKPEFKEGTQDNSILGDFPRRSLVALDNFSIKYFGANADNSVKILVYNYLQQTAAKVALLNEAGQAAYDVSEVIRRYNSNALSSDGSVEIAMIDAAYEIALRAHNAKEAEDALEENDGDVTGLIVNPSFEQGITGWTVGAGWDCGVKYNGAEGSTYYVSNAHSDVTETIDQYQLYNGYGGEGMLGAGPVTQTITGLKNGLYELKALVTSFKGNTVYILGNDYHAGVEVKTGKTHFEEATLLFMVEDGTAKIGAMGSSFGGYYYTEGCFYKADNFRLRYICDPAHGRVYLAHQEATAVLETFDGTAKDYAAVTTTADDRLGELLERYKNADSRQIATLVNTDGTAAASAIYAALTKTALQQKAVGSDMTWCINDPSFELGKYVDGGWSRLNNADVKAAKQTDNTYKAVGTIGSYLFNAWHDNNVASPLTYTINGIPNGTYRLTAKVTSDAGNKVFLTAGSARSSIEATNVTEGTDDIEQLGEVSFSSFKNKRLEVENEAGKIICQSSVNPNNNLFSLGKDGTLTITVEPNTDETLVITEAIITYYSKDYTGSFSDATQNTTDKTWTKSGLNTTSVEFKNSSSKNTAVITNITVKYKRQYHAPHVILPAKHMMRDISLDFEVTGGKVTIGVAGGKDGAYTATGGCWYKADDFHLQLLFPKEDNQQSKTLYLSENATYMPDVDFSRDAQSRSQYGNIYGYSKVTVERTLTHGSWGTLVLPFDLSIANLGDGNWDVRELSESENETDDVVVTFTTPTNGKIKAGKCYIVRHNSQDLSKIEIDVDNQTKFITTADYFDTSCGAEGNNQMVEFIGTYTRGYVPVGSFFINSKNQFKEVVKANTNKIKGFRGYFTVKSEAQGRVLSFRLGEGTGVDSVNNGEVTVVAIYNLQGMRLNDMEPGINILQMSDGSSVKVLIK